MSTLVSFAWIPKAPLLCAFVPAVRRRLETISTPFPEPKKSYLIRSVKTVASNHPRPPPPPGNGRIYVPYFMFFRERILHGNQWRSTGADRPNRTTRSDVLKPDKNTTVFIIPTVVAPAAPVSPDGQLDLSTAPPSSLFRVCVFPDVVCSSPSVNIVFKRYPARGQLLVAFRKRVKCVSDTDTDPHWGALARHPRFPIVVANSHTFFSLFTFSLPLCASGLYDCRCRTAWIRNDNRPNRPLIFAYRTFVMTTPSGCQSLFVLVA